MIDLILFPFGGNARESLLSIEAQNQIKPLWNVLGFVDDDEGLWGQEYCGYKVLGGKSKLKDYPSAEILAVPGNPSTYLARKKIISQLQMAEERFATVIDYSARVAPDAIIGKNTLIMANVIISCSSIVGKHCVILPNTVVAHDCHVGDYTLIGSNVTISGRCYIDDCCYIGSGAKIKENITIGTKTIVGIGSCVIRDLPMEKVAAGNPARVIRSVEDKLK